MDAPRQPLGEGGAWVARGGAPLLLGHHAPHPHISNFPAEASPGSWGWGKGTESATPRKGVREPAPSASASAWVGRGEGERSTGKGAVRRRPQHALCPPSSQSWFSAAVPTGSCRRAPRAPCSRQPPPASIVCFSQNPGSFPPSPPSALSLLLCGVLPLQLWATRSPPSSRFTQESAASGYRAHACTPGHHHLWGWPDPRPGWLWRAILRSEASSPSGLCPSLRM